MENKLQEKVKLAEEAVKEISDKSLRDKAFEIILNNLLNEPSRNIPGQMTAFQQERSNFEEDVSDLLINQIDSTAYPIIYKMYKTIDRALYVLILAKNDYKIDGLNSNQISKILSIKFRLPTSPNSVSMALMKVGRYANRVLVNSIGGTAYEYRVTYPGEEYLKKILENPPKEDFISKKVKKATTGDRIKPKKIKEGLKKRIIDLKDEDFFREAKEVKEVQESLELKGHIYTHDPVAVALLRLVKKGLLRRVKDKRDKRDKKNIYKYCNP